MARNELDQNSATEAFRNALELLEQLLAKHPDAPYLQFVYADAVTTLAPPQARRAGVPIQRAVQIANTLARDYPQVPDYVALKAKTLLARNEQSTVSQAIGLMQQLVDDYPSLLHYRLILANALQRLATLKHAEADRVGARQALQQAVEVLTKAAEPGSSTESEGELPWMISLNIERLRQQLKALGED